MAQARYQDILDAIPPSTSAIPAPVTPPEGDMDLDNDDSKQLIKMME